MCESIRIPRSFSHSKRAFEGGILMLLTRSIINAHAQQSLVFLWADFECLKFLNHPTQNMSVAGKIEVIVGPMWYPFAFSLKAYEQAFIKGLGNSHDGPVHHARHQQSNAKNGEFNMKWDPPVDLIQYKGSGPSLYRHAGLISHKV
ncbi:hypothetical protein VNO77_03450 [Canavalia gladiata]|uniref:Uncharacterized protein n=1 Tax=Canavalia gladiata TaxID=3824 RepID=A0AAN9MZR0_CANGL